jgi:hypothetical protein
LQAKVLDGASDRRRIEWMPVAFRILHEELPNIEVMMVPVRLRLRRGVDAKVSGREPIQQDGSKGIVGQR